MDLRELRRAIDRIGCAVEAAEMELAMAAEAEQRGDHDAFARSRLRVRNALKVIYDEAYGIHMALCSAGETGE